MSEDLKTIASRLRENAITDYDQYLRNSIKLRKEIIELELKSINRDESLLRGDDEEERKRQLDKWYVTLENNLRVGAIATKAKQDEKEAKSKNKLLTQKL